MADGFWTDGDGYWEKRFVGWGRRCKRTRDEKRNKDEPWQWVTVARQRKKQCRNRNARRRRTVVSMASQEVFTFWGESENYLNLQDTDTNPHYFPFFFGTW
jgi:hypothetical protein